MISLTFRFSVWRGLRERRFLLCQHLRLYNFLQKFLPNERKKEESDIYVTDVTSSVEDSSVVPLLKTYDFYHLVFIYFGPKVLE